MTNTFQPYRKGTVLAPTGPCNHLHVICNDPVYYPINDCYCVLVVNISSIKDGVPHDPTCALDVGDHPFVQHPSYVVYAQAVIWRVDNVIRKEAAGEIMAHQDMPEATFSRILNGFDISDDVSPKHLKFKNQHCVTNSTASVPLTGS